jgi:hypothetical protein
MGLALNRQPVVPLKQPHRQTFRLRSLAQALLQAQQLGLQLLLVLEPQRLL